MRIEPVSDDEVLYRRVPNRQDNFKVEEGRICITSQAFSDRAFRPSVDRALLCNQDPSYSQNDPSDAVVFVIACHVRGINPLSHQDAQREARNYTTDVEARPIHNQPGLPDNPAHAEIYTAPPPTKGVFRKIKEALARMADWSIRPANTR